MINKLIAIVIVGVVCLKCIDSQILPSNPCPNLFQYFQNNGIIYGRMEFPNDNSGFYQLTANMSVAAYLTDNNKNIRLELRTSANELAAGRSVIYFVYFPIQDVIPKPTRIEFNGVVYCAGPPEQVGPGRGVTNMWASTYFRITGPIRPQRPNAVYDIIQLTEIPFQQPVIPTQSPVFTQPTEPAQDPIFTLPTLQPQPPLTSQPVLPTQPTPFIVPTRPSTSSAGAPFTSPPKSIPKPSSTGTNVPVPPTNPTKNEECGYSSINTQQLVVNGDKVAEGQYPWLVAVMYTLASDYKYRCAGTLVSNRHVITAAHCVQFHKVILFPPEEVLLIFGKNNIKNWANGAVIRNAQNITVHPDYKHKHGDGDIAVITLNRPVHFQTFIRPACLWQEDAELDKIVGQEGTVVGWGKDETGVDYVPEAKKINLPIVSQVTCLRSDPGFSNITSTRTFCAGNRNGSGPCTGDSGGGFIMNRNGKWTLRGIVSTALGDASTCDLTNYFVFADVAKVKAWMQQAMA